MPEAAPPARLSWLHGLRGFGSTTALAELDKEYHSPRNRSIHSIDLRPQAHSLKRSSSHFSKSHRQYTMSRVQAERKWISCCGSFLVFPCLTLLFSLGFTIGLAAFLWEHRKPVVREGAFGKLALNTRAESVQEANFVKAQAQAVSGPTLLGLNIGGNGTVLGASEGFEWRRLELIYQQPGTQIGELTLQAALQFENDLRASPGWMALCTRVPYAQRRYCDPGDSLPAVIYGTKTAEMSAELIAAGVTEAVQFDGGASVPFLPIATILNYLTTFHPDAIKRWYNIDVRYTALSETEAVRTMFAFYLPTKYLSEWNSVLSNELDSKLKAAIENGVGSSSLFYRADGVETQEFDFAVTNALNWAFVAAFGCLVSTVMITRRLLLGIAVVLLAGVASATAAAAVSQYHEDGFVEFPAVAIAAWFLNSAASADLAVACLKAWEADDPFPGTIFAEVCRVIALRLHTLPRPASKKKCKTCGYYILQCFAYIVDTAFPPRIEGGEAPETDCFGLANTYWYLVHLTVPALVPILALVTIAAYTELLLLEEFAMHAGPGLLACTFFGMMLFPPVIEVGDVLSLNTVSCSWDRCRCCVCCNNLCRLIGLCTKKLKGHCVPMECGGAPAWRDKMRPVSEVFAITLNGRPMRIFAMILSVLVIVGFSISEFTSKFVPTAPALFPVGHRSREGPKVKAFYGRLPRNLDAPSGKPLTGTNICKPDAYDSMNCAWYRCEMEQLKEAVNGKCECKVRGSGGASSGAQPTTRTTTTTRIVTTVPSVIGGSPPGITPTGSCSASARIVGLPSQDYLNQANFWDWTENTLGYVIGDGNNQVLKPEVLGGIEMEDWSSGEKIERQQFSIGLKTANEDFPRLENACVSLLCYCNTAPCQLGDSWSHLGDADHIPIPVAGAAATSTTTTIFGARRLLTNDTQSKDFLRPLTNMRKLDTSLQASTTTSIHIIWGLHRSEEIPFRSSSIELKFERSFQMQHPWAQRDIYRFCEGTTPELAIASRHCWVIDFKRWLTGQGERYPLRADVFYERYFQFTIYRHTHGSLSIGGGESSSDDFNFFWLSDTGQIQGTYATFQVNAPSLSEYDALMSFIGAWTNYVDIRNTMGKPAVTGQAWMASPIFASSQTVDAVRASTYLSVAVMASLTCSAVLLLTCSMGIALAVLVSLVLALFTFVTFWTSLGNRDVSSLEVVSLTVFFTGLVVPLIRIATAYSYATDLPDVPEHYMPSPLETEPPRSMSLQRSSAIIGVDKALASMNFAPNVPENEEILLFPGAISSERQNRVATAFIRAGGQALCMGVASVFAGASLLFLEMEALGQVGVAQLCLGFAVPPAALGLLPLLLLLGLGGSKARKRALAEVATYFCDKCRGKVSERQGLLDGRSTTANPPSTPSSKKPHVVNDAAKKHHKAGDMETHSVAAIMLGVPTGLVTAKTWKPHFALPSNKLKSHSEKDKGADIAEEMGPCIMALDVQGATAKPPYHIVMATRDVINAKG